MEINPAFLNGSITPPASKSHVIRLLAAALLSNGETIIENISICDDVDISIQIIKNLGATVIPIDENSLKIISKGIKVQSNELNMGESALAARLFTPIACLSGEEITINALPSLTFRPMQDLEKLLLDLGIQVSSKNGHLPFILKGKLIPKSLKIAGNLSSQYLTGLLFALSFSAKNKIEIEVENLKSKPYIDLSIAVLNNIGKDIEVINYNKFIIHPHSITEPQNIKFKAEADWSAAANLFVAAAINGNITVHNCHLNSCQADKKIITILQLAQVALSISENEITVKKSPIKGFEYDFTDCPDLFPIATVLAAAANGESTLNGLSRLIHKESNRKENILNLLNQWQVPYKVYDDTLLISGIKEFQSTSFNGENDHRMFMAAVVGALKCKNGLTLFGKTDAVAKSYPNFYSDLSNLGLPIKF